MEIPNLREEFRRDYLVKLLEQIGKERNISLWQSIDKNRIMAKATLLKINNMGSYLTFTPNEKKGFEFNSRKPIYLFEEDRTLIFKSQICFHSKFSMEVKIPESLMLEEYRSIMRSHNFKRGQTVAYRFENVRPLMNRNGEYKRRLIDCSEKGLSFRVSAEEAGMYYDGDMLEFIVNDNGKRFGRVVYTSPFLDGIKQSSKYHRVGVSYVT